MALTSALTRRLLLLALLASCKGSPPAADATTLTDAGPVDLPGEQAPDGAAIDPALRAQIFAEVEAYLTAEDPGPAPPLLARLEAEYREVPFAVFAEAVRHRPSPPRLPATGLHQATWTDPIYNAEETYHLYLPPGLASSGLDRFPLVIFLHGAGGNGAGIAADPAVQAVAERLGALLVAPDCNPQCDWNEREDCMAQVVLLVRQLKRRYPVDDARVVLSGFSMGGRGSFSIGVAYPEPYAGVVPVAGSIGAVFGTDDREIHRKYCCPHVENLRNVRLHYQTGDQDMDLMLYQNRACELCLKALPNEYVYSELAGQGHVWPLDRWEQALTWTLAKPRARYPAVVVYNLYPQASALVPTGLWLQQGLRLPQYWAHLVARVDGSKPARLEATREPERLRLAGENVAEVDLYLADELLDLSRPVTVVEGETVLFQGTVARDRAFLLEEARRRGDRSMIFANHLRVIFPAP